MHIIASFSHGPLSAHPLQGAAPHPAQQALGRAPCGACKAQETQADSPIHRHDGHDGKAWINGELPCTTCRNELAAHPRTCIRASLASPLLMVHDPSKGIGASTPCHAKPCLTEGFLVDGVLVGVVLRPRVPCLQESVKLFSHEKLAS